MNSPTHYPYLGYWVLHLGPYKVLCTLYAYKVRNPSPPKPWKLYIYILVYLLQTTKPYSWLIVSLEILLLTLLGKFHHYFGQNNSTSMAVARPKDTKNVDLNQMSVSEQAPTRLA